MTSKTTPGRTSATAHRQYRTSGWLAFAGTVALVVGAFNVIDGLVALFKDDYYLVADNEIMVFDYTAWGWIWLILGIIQIGVGAAIMSGKMWARAIGVVFAFLAAIGHLAFLVAFPLWSVLTISLCILLIYALTAPPPGARAD
ncbi:hypothetical protein BZB76_6589 [Actinomadura pelletieri DSM 43383]|uniref:DUF7144 domain-containing protein n=1 Tax=Actinomadura pelletieri DSM 43383 TaxID=1120940 RepID=A0A495QAJ2_9ACTN|nr:hypothetical protein [Actinomadura pelletieri]RKS68326.1 hypothetical protein BZB76_6589 [Actinomadura pelletieri DSM 43383]